MKTILVTGGAGFNWLPFSRFPSSSGASNSCRGRSVDWILEECRTFIGNSQVEWIQGSVADEELVRQAIARVDTVYHLAAAVGVALIAKEPSKRLNGMLLPTQHLLAEINRSICKELQSKSLGEHERSIRQNPKEVWSEDDDLVFGSKPALVGLTEPPKRSMNFWGSAIGVSHDFLL